MAQGLVRVQASRLPPDQWRGWEPQRRGHQTETELRRRPFWEPDQLLSDDFDELNRWLGISRDTFDAAMAWNERWAERRHQRADPTICERERHELIARIRAEAHESFSFE